MYDPNNDPAKRSSNDPGKATVNVYAPDAPARVLKQTLPNGSTLEMGKL
jgi:hypothetical protein